jgi:FkbM family methyltransferase
VSFTRRYSHYFIVGGALLGVWALVGSYYLGRYFTMLERLPYIQGEDELRALEQKYSGERSSLLGEEWMVREYFRDKRDGVFVDVGANDYRWASNTYYLETELGWSGIAVEPQAKFAADYQRHRPRTQFVPLFVSDQSDVELDLFVPSDDLLASASRAYASEGSDTLEVVATRTSTLDDILDAHQVTRIDFLSIDVEMHEPEVLAGFSIDRFRPTLVCIEGHREVRQQILDYFAAHDYVLIGDYLRADGHNLWFKPLAATPPESPGSRGHRDHK